MGPGFPVCLCMSLCTLAYIQMCIRVCMRLSVCIFVAMCVCIEGSVNSRGSVGAVFSVLLSVATAK